MKGLVRCAGKLQSGVSEAKQKPDQIAEHVQPCQLQPISHTRWRLAIVHFTYNVETRGDCDKMGFSEMMRRTLDQRNNYKSRGYTLKSTYTIFMYKLM